MRIKQNHKCYTCTAHSSVTHLSQLPFIPFTFIVILCRKCIGEMSMEGMKVDMNGSDIDEEFHKVKTMTGKVTKKCKVTGRKYSKDDKNLEELNPEIVEMMESTVLHEELSRPTETTM